MKKKKKSALLSRLYIKKKKLFVLSRSHVKKKKPLVLSRSHAKKKKQFEFQYEENDNFDSNNNILNALNNLDMGTNVELDIDAKQSLELFVKKSNKIEIVAIAVEVTREHAKVYYRDEKSLKRQ